NMDSEIRKVFKKCPFCAETIAIEAVKCRYCGEWVDGRGASRASAKYSDAQPVWHFVLLSIVTFAVYDLYWFYRTWRQLRDQENWDISPGWRLVGLFIPILNLILLYDLFKHIRDFADAENCEVLFSPGLILIGWLLFNALVALPDPYWLITLMSVWPIGVVQNTLNNYWSQKQPTLIMKTKLSAGQKALLILGGIWWGLVIWGFMIPDYYPTALW
ncbi:MAG: DUF4234 domain-containing protein, partial [Dehalococcoidales bacterium]